MKICFTCSQPKRKVNALVHFLFQFNSKPLYFFPTLSKPVTSGSLKFLNFVHHPISGIKMKEEQMYYSRNKTNTAPSL